MSDDAQTLTRAHALAAIDWRGGASRAAILDALASQPELQALLRRHLPEGTYFAVTDVVAALSEEAARESGLVVISGSGIAEPGTREIFAGVTPEGLGAAIRTTAGELVREMEAPAPWLGATMRSAAVPGWGQWHNGRVEKAIAFAAAALALGVASGVPGAMSRAARGKPQMTRSGGVRPFWLGLLAATYIASLFDAYDDATRVTG